MRRSVLVRFLGLSLAVALGAVIATAVIATYSTSEQLQGEIDANTGQLQVDGRIYADLSKYGTDHPTWAGVDKLVHDLSDELGRRIALTDSDGAVIADSARMLGAGPALPSVPAATIDARSQGTANVSGALSVYNARKTMVAGKANEMVSAAAMPGVYPAYPGWGLTDEEKRERDQLAEKATECYRAQGKTATVSSAGGGDMPVVMVENGQAADGTSQMQVSKPGALDDKCMPPGLNAPSAKAKLVNDDEIRRATDCLEAAGQLYTVTEFDGLRAVEPKDKAELTDEFFTCTSEARSQALAPYVAPSAKLYLGAKSTFNVFSGEGLLRTAATALGVLLIAALVMCSPVGGWCGRSGR